MAPMSIDQVKDVATICTSVSAIATVSRLIIKRNALGIDDIWVSLAITAMLVKLWTICKLSEANIANSSTYYTILVTFYTSLWFSRIAVLFSLIRVAPKRHQRVMYIFFAIFLAIYILLVGQTVWVCESQKVTIGVCMPNREMALFEILGDAFADLSLVCLSLTLFTIIQERALRYRLMSIFSTCIGTSIVSLIHGLYILKYGATLEVLVIAIVESTVSTLVANIPVLTTFFINRFSSLRSPSGHSRQNSTNSYRVSGFSLRITHESACGGNLNNSPRNSRSHNGTSRSIPSRTSASTIIFERPSSIPTHPEFDWNNRRSGGHPLVSMRRQAYMEMELEFSSGPDLFDDDKYDSSPIAYPPKCI